MVGPIKWILGEYTVYIWDPFSSRFRCRLTKFDFNCCFAGISVGVLIWFAAVINYYHAMTFWNFSTLWFISLVTKRYLSRTFSGLCLNYPIHILKFFQKWNRICGPRRRKGYHLLKKCHGNVTDRLRWLATAACQIQSPMKNCNQIKRVFERSLNFSPWCHALPRPNVDESVHMHNLTEFLETSQLQFHSL